MTWLLSVSYWDLTQHSPVSKGPWSFKCCLHLACFVSLICWASQVMADKPGLEHPLNWKRNHASKLHGRPLSLKFSAMKHQVQSQQWGVFGISLDRVSKQAGSWHLESVKRRGMPWRTVVLSSVAGDSGLTEVSQLSRAPKTMCSIKQTSFTGLKVGAGAGACVPPAAVPAPAVPQRKQTTLHTSSGGFIPARGLEMQPDGETTASLQPSQEALLFGKLGDEITEKEFEGCSTIYNTGMVPCAL